MLLISVEMLMFTLASLFLGVCEAQANAFIFPQPDPSLPGNYSRNLLFSRGSTQTLEWTSNYTSWELFLVHDSSTVLLQNSILNGTGSGSQTKTSYSWDVAVTSDTLVNSALVYYFALYEGSSQHPTGTTTQFHSHYFNISLTADTTTTSSSAVSSSTASASSSSTVSSSVSSSTGTASTAASSATSTPSSSSTAVTKSTSSTGLSTGAKIAIAVVIPVFLIALIIGAVLFHRRRNARKSHYIATQELHGDNSMQKPLGGEDFGASAVAARPVTTRYEMSDTSSPQELDSLSGGAEGQARRNEKSPSASIRYT